LETEAMFREVVVNGMPADKLLTADFTFANDRLAKHYGLPAVGSTTPVKVNLAATERRGILSQGSFLTVTSHQNRTSPVLRGKWVLTQLLCLEVPPPPPDVNVTLDPAKAGGTLRQQMEAHRANPVCATCHKQMDPIGLGLENYDAIGVHRTTDQGLPIDASGELPDGRQFNGAQQLSTLVALNSSTPMPWAGLRIERPQVTWTPPSSMASANRFAAPTISRISSRRSRRALRS
jgi:hypothetical protein